LLQFLFTYGFKLGINNDDPAVTVFTAQQTQITDRQLTRAEYDHMVLQVSQQPLLRVEHAQNRFNYRRGGEQGCAEKSDPE
jgi:hypothetical protein